MFEHDVLSRATENFSSNLLLGRGGFSEVYRGYLYGSQVAIKRLIEVILLVTVTFKCVCAELCHPYI